MRKTGIALHFLAYSAIAFLFLSHVIFYALGAGAAALGVEVGFGMLRGKRR